MPSPFPGMDPYLEWTGLWPDFHLALINEVRTALASQVAPRYYVAVEQRTYIVAAEPTEFAGRPDVAVIGMPPLPASTLGGAPAAVLDRSITVELPIRDEIRERYLEIRESTTHKVITVIEILSPSNKQRGEGRNDYERKRQRVLDSATNLVEIDLLRAGEPMPMARVPASHYRILVSREWERPRAKLYPFNLNEAIPEIPVPLQKGEAEPALGLGKLFAEIYDQVRYDLRIDYTGAPEPALDSATAVWSQALLSAIKPR
ncbi:MAG: DUF4058 family protein [Chloroflexi bacterium]|nr:DUF4058 family protein [Chloroflexota bacterium]